MRVADLNLWHSIKWWQQQQSQQAPDGLGLHLSFTDACYYILRTLSRFNCAKPTLEP
jgi:hypothetical protein